MLGTTIKVRSAWYVVLSVAMATLAASVQAESEVVDGATWYYSISGNEAQIVAGSVKYAGDLSTPSTLGGCPVTSIGSSAFYNCSGLMSITIRDGVANIESSAFEGCSGMTSVVIPVSVTNIGASAFSGCSGLTSVTIPDRFNVFCVDEGYIKEWLGLEYLPDGTFGSMLFDGVFGKGSVISNVTILVADGKIGSYSFFGGGQLKSVTIPEGITSIGGSAFMYCSGLSSMIIPESVTNIGCAAFYGCSGLSSVSIPESVTNVGYATFRDCSGLKTITIPAGVARVDDCAFNGCTGLTTVNLSEGLSKIGAGAFYGCINLATVSFPQGLGTIGGSAFSGCINLATVSFPSGVSEVGVGAFTGCSVKSLLFDNPNGEFLDHFSKESLRMLFLGAHAGGITGGLLYDCYVLETIMTAAANPNYCTDDGVLYDKAKTRLIKYPCAVTTARYAVPASVTDIDEGAFAFTSTLTELTFGGDVDTIGDSVFDWCLGLRQVTFNGVVNFIGDGAFMVCPSLESLSFKGDSPLWGSNQFWYSTPTVYAERGTAGWDDAAAKVGFVVSYIDSGETSVPKSWIDQYPEFLAAAGGDYEAAANSVGANGVTLRESYVAGLDPTDEKSKFTVNLTIVDGEPVITWSPDLSDDAQPRNYTTYGKRTLSSTEDWHVVTDANKSSMQFFKVAVGMP